jgi:hypothetical protein
LRLTAKSRQRPASFVFMPTQTNPSLSKPRKTRRAYDLAPRCRSCSQRLSIEYDVERDQWWHHCHCVPEPVLLVRKIRDAAGWQQALEERGRYLAALNGRYVPKNLPPQRHSLNGLFRSPQNLTLF